MNARSLTRATLYRVALGATLVVVVSCAVTYRLLFGEIEQRALERLHEYAGQRAAYHESRFSLARAFHDVIKADFVARYREPAPDAARRFDALMERQADGAIRNRPQFADVTRHSTGWIHRRVEPDAEFKRRWMLFYDLSQHYARLVTTRFINFYFMHPTEPANMGFDDPVRSGNIEWAALTPADYPLWEREFFTAANAANNPERRTLWAGPYLEPVYGQMFVTAITPVYVGDEHVATIGSDDMMSELEASVLRADLPGTTHTVFRGDGRLIADPQYMRRIAESSAGFDIAATGDRRLEALLRRARAAGAGTVHGYDGDVDQYYAVSLLQSTGWYFASTLPGELVRKHAFQAAQWVLWTGIVSLVLLLAGLALILRPAFDAMLRSLAERDTELARQRETLHQRERLAAMGSLLAGVAHELNNPLSIVVARATLLEEGATDPAVRSSVEKIRAAAERCARIVRTFLTMARQGKPQQGAVDLNRLIEDCLEMLAYGLRTAGVQVEHDLDARLPEVSGNADQLHQVFLNLLINAQQALEGQPEPRRLRVTSRQEGGSLVVRVADNGPGIPEAIRSRIFDPYFTTKPLGGGTGVGLAVSLGIVSAHDGTLTVDCPPAGGAVFEVRLPVPATQAAVERPLPAPAAQAGGRRSFLIVDDEPELAALLADILREDAATIDIAASGSEALARLREREYDVILTDLRMPEMDGPELYRQVRQRWPHLAASMIFISGDALSPAVQRFLAEVDRPLLEKPFAPAEVRRHCRAVRG